MKRVITIAIVVLLVLGFGYYLFKISPQQQPQTSTQTENFDLSGVKEQKEPSPISSDDHILGNKDAKNTFIIYEDFQCPACANFAPIVKQVPSNLKDTKVVFRHYPLLELHRNAPVAAFAAEAAGAQGKFWEMADQLYTRQSEWNQLDNPTDKFVELAKAAGVSNIDQFKNDLATKKYKPVVQKDLVEGMSLGVRGTPTVYFNNQQLQLGDINTLKAQAEKLYK